VIQEILAATTVTAAAVYLGFKLLLLPSLRAKRPDVPVSRLLRKRSPRNTGGSGCH